MNPPSVRLSSHLRLLFVPYRLPLSLMYSNGSSYRAASPIGISMPKSIIHICANASCYNVQYRWPKAGLRLSLVCHSGYLLRSAYLGSDFREISKLTFFHIAHERISPIFVEFLALVRSLPVIKLELIAKTDRPSSASRSDWDPSSKHTIETCEPRRPPAPKGGRTTASENIACLP